MYECMTIHKWLHINVTTIQYCICVLCDAVAMQVHWGAKLKPATMLAPWQGKKTISLWVTKQVSLKQSKLTVECDEPPYRYSTNDANFDILPFKPKLAVTNKNVKPHEEPPIVSAQIK